MKISQRANCIEPSLTRDLFNRAQEFDDVINLTLGDPDLLPPQNIRDAACFAIQNGKTRYSANAGLLEVRKAIASSFMKEYNLPCDLATEVMTTVGGDYLRTLLCELCADGTDERRRSCNHRHKGRKWFFC